MRSIYQSDRFLADKTRRHFTLLTIVEESVLGTLFLPWAVRSASHDGALLGALLAGFGALIFAILALNAEIFFNLGFGEHVVAWSLPAVFGYWCLVTFLSPRVVLPLLVLLVLVPWDAESFVLTWWVHHWSEHLDDHPYLYHTVMETRPRLFVGLPAATGSLLVAVTVLVAYLLLA